VRYFRADIYQMILVRSAMIAAGVNEKLVFKKFVSNDDFLVTPHQSALIGEKLKAWLKGRNLVLDLSERNERAKVGNQAYFDILLQLGNRQDKETARIFSKDKPLPVKLDPAGRKVIRDFAEFCMHSGGFWVA